MTFRFGSVCSGIEAASCAWHPLGWRTAFVSEIEPFPCAVLAHHYPTVPNLGDMTKFKEWPDAAIDLLVGGTPCQSFSVAGLRKGLADPRGNLMLTYLAIAERYAPRWLVWENVPGVLSSNGGRNFGTFLGGLAELGYGFAYRVLDALDFGCFCPRPRVFVVAHSGGLWQRAAAVLFQRECLDWNRAPADSRAQIGTSPVFTRLGAMAYDDRTPCVLESNGARRATPLEWERALGFPDDYTNIDTKSGVSRGQAPLEHDDTLRHDAGAIRRSSEEAERLLRSLRRTDGATGDRSLSPDGQGSRDSLSSMQYQAASCRGYGVGDAGLGLPRGRRVADGPRYKALGNSMAIPVMSWLGQRIQMVEDLCNNTNAERAV